MKKLPRITASEAVSEWVQPGETMYLGNFGSQLFSIGHEIIRQGIGNLNLVVSVGGLLLDQLIGAGQVERAVSSHCWNTVGPLPAHNFRRALEKKEPDLEYEEFSLGTLTSALMAGAYGMPFVPTTPMSGAGHERHRTFLGEEKFQTVPSPFNGKETTVVKGMRPDVGFLLVHQSDASGNAQWFGPSGDLRMAALACRHVVIVAERMVSRETIKERPEATLPIHNPQAIVVEPWSAHPESIYGSYHRDVEHMVHYTEKSETEAGFRRYLEEWVLGVENRREYVEKLRSAGRLNEDREELY